MEWVIDSLKKEARDFSTEAQKCMDNMEKEAKKLTKELSNMEKEAKKLTKELSVEAKKCMDNVLPESI